MHLSTPRQAGLFSCPKIILSELGSPDPNYSMPRPSELWKATGSATNSVLMDKCWRVPLDQPFWGHFLHESEVTGICFSHRYQILPYFSCSHILTRWMYQGRIQAWADPALPPPLTGKSCKFSLFWGDISQISPNFDTWPPLFANPGSGPGCTVLWKQYDE